MNMQETYTIMSSNKLLQIRRRLLDGMIEFMESDEESPESDQDCGYSRADVDRCAEIVDDYLKTVKGKLNAGQSEILGSVQQAIEQLNALNNSCDGCLIETDQREDLCALILAAAKEAGLESDDDVTEPWRDW